MGSSTLSVLNNDAAFFLQCSSVPQHMFCVRLFLNLAVGGVACIISGVRFDPVFGSDQCRSYAAKYAAKAEKWLSDMK